MDKKIGFIGAGNMATAIINGLLKNKVVAPENINVFDVNENQLKLMAEKGVTTCDTSTKVVTDSNIIVLAVKPQNYEEVLSGVKDSVSEEKIFVSIAPLRPNISFTTEKSSSLILSDGQRAVAPLPSSNGVFGIKWFCRNRIKVNGGTQCTVWIFY